MKILKLLNNSYLPILLIILFIALNVKAEDEPIDIWNIDENKIKETQLNNTQSNLETNDTKISQPSIYDLQSQKEIETVQVSSSLNSQEVKIIGLYDTEDYDLKIDLWSNSNGDQLKNLFSNLAKLDLSKDASELMNIVLLTNAYNHKINTQKGGSLKLDNIDTAFYVYAIEWFEDRIDFFINDEKYYSFQNDNNNNFKTWPFNQRFHLLINIAVGGDWPGSPDETTSFPTEMKIDYVRVYQKTEL